MLGRYDGGLSLHPDLGYEYKWAEKREFLKDIAQNPANYTPWAKEAVRLLPEN